MGRAVLPTVREKSSHLPGERAAHRTNPAARVQSTHGTQQAETKVDTRHLSLGRTTLRDLCSQTHESHKQRPVAAQSAAQPTLCRRPCARTRARDWEKTRGLPWRLPGNTHAGRGRFKFAGRLCSTLARARTMRRPQTDAQSLQRGGASRGGLLPRAGGGTAATSVLSQTGRKGISDLLDVPAAAPPMHCAAGEEYVRDRSRRRHSNTMACRQRLLDQTRLISASLLPHLF